MSVNVFYCDLDTINNKGVLVTGHGKGIVNRNPLINGKYIANDMVRLVVKNGKLFGYQGYIPKEENYLVEIEYIIYLFDQYEPHQPATPINISVDSFIRLSKHNIETGVMCSLSSTSSAFIEYSDILKQVFNAKFIAFPFTNDENERARAINEIII